MHFHEYSNLCFLIKQPQTHKEKKSPETTKSKIYFTDDISTEC